jgi:phage shock protein A
MEQIYKYCEDDVEMIKEEVGNQNKKATHLELDKEKVEQGLAKLVLTLIQLIRRLMEKQAITRIEKESLTDEQIEDLGNTFMKLDEKMEELKETFDLKDEDLNLNLGPLGDLM